MHTKINIVKKLSGAYHNVWYEKSILQYWYSVCSSLEPELTQREYSHFFHTRLYHCRSHPLWWGLLLHIFFRIGRETSRRRGVKLPSSYLSRIFDRITMHRTATRCRAAKVYREERKKNMKKNLKVSNSFSRYRTYPKLHMMHICTMGYIRIIPD